MRSLWYISIFCLIFGCSQTPLYQNLPPSTVKSLCLHNLKPDFTAILYNAHVNVMGKHLSGLLLFKIMPDSTTRVVFSNEMGVTFFDFEYSMGGFRVMHCIKQLNKKAAINQLKKDLGMLIMHDVDIGSAKVLQGENRLYFGFFSGKEQTHYLTNATCTKLLRIENADKKKKKVIINLTDYKGGMPDSVYIAHQTFEFNISLKQINR